MKKILFIISLSISVLGFAQWIQLGNGVNGIASNDRFGKAVSISGNGKVIAVSSFGQSGWETKKYLKTYRFINDNWEQIGSTIDGPYNAYSDLYDSNVSLNFDGSILAFSSNKVRIYKNVQGNWEQIGNDIEDRAGSIELNAEGNIIAVGRIYGTDSVKVYNLLGNTWQQLGNTLLFYNARFGSQISINNSGSTIAVGVIENAGSMYQYDGPGYVGVFKNISNTWTLLGDTIRGDSLANEFGFSLSLDSLGETIIVGAIHFDTSKGIAKVYKYQLNNWEQVGNSIIANNNEDWLGNSVDISANGEFIAVASSKNDENLSNSGKITFYKSISENWVPTDSIYGIYLGEEAGSSISLSANGNSIVIGAIYNDVASSDAGQARVYSNICQNIQDFSFPNDTNICSNSSIELNGVYGATNTWSTGDTSNFIMVSDSGYYYLSANYDSCAVLDSIHISIRQAPNVNLLNDTNICLNDSILLDAGIQDNYYWSTGDTTQSIFANSQGTYYVTVTKDNNCFDIDTININNYVLNNEVPDSIINCLNNNIDIIANPTYSNIWNSTISNDTINYTITNDTVFYIQSTDTNNCILEDSVLIFSTTQVEFSQDNQNYIFTAINNLGLDFTWIFSDGDTLTGETVSHTFQTANIYEVCLITSNTCIDTICNLIDVNCIDSLVNYLPTDTFVYPNNNYEFEIDDIFQSYIWSTGDTTNNVEILSNDLYNNNTINISAILDSNCTISNSFNIEKYHCQQYNLSIDTNGLNLNNNILLLTENELVTFHATDPDFFANNTYYSQTESQLTYYWNFNDSSAINIGNPVSHIFTEQGTNYIYLYALDQYGCISNIGTPPVYVSIPYNPNFTSVNVNPLEICLGDCVMLSAYGEDTGHTTILMNNDFNNLDIGYGWNSNFLPYFDNPCFPSLDGSPSCWIGDNTCFPRDLTTEIFDITASCEICFDFVMATQGNNTPCEGPDEMDEGVSLQYSINQGIDWEDITYFCPDGNLYPTNSWVGQSTAGGGTGTPFNIWTNYCFNIPAIISNTQIMIRWHQGQGTSNTYDHWGIDNVLIKESAPNTFITWSNNTGVIYNGNGAFEQCPTQNTTYTAIITDSTLSDTAVFNVVVNQLPNIWLGNDTTICQGETLNLNAGTFESYTWNDLSTSQSIDVNSSGEYSVVVSDINNCIASDTINVNVEICIGVDENMNEYKILIYPNPSTNQLTVNSNINIKSIEIVDIMGITVNKIKISKLLKQEITKYYNFNIDISSLEEGIYFVKINSNILIKFVKN